ncbi:MAG: hypothetical protein WBN70_13290, partial [Polyangiales bacterium]
MTAKPKSEAPERAPEGSRKTSGWLIRIALALFVLLTMLGIGECALRVGAPLPYSSRLEWIDDGHIKARLL